MKNIISAAMAAACVVPSQAENGSPDKPGGLSI